MRIDDAMHKEAMLASCERAKRALGIFTNQAHEYTALNRLRKFLHAPAKVTRVALYRAGFLKDPDVRARMFWGADLTLPIWDEDAIIAYYTGCLGFSESPLVAYLLRHLNPQSVFYDIGSNLGLYTALAEALGAEVHSFEPNPRTARYIAMNAKASSTVNTLALSDHAGRTQFFEASYGRKIGMSSFFPGIVPQSLEKPPRPIEVETIALDSYAVRHTPPTVMKIDVMGADSLVLAGGQALLMRSAPIIALRFYHTPAVPGGAEKTLALLSSAGYRPYRLEPNGALAPTEVLLSNVTLASTFIFKKS